MSAARGTRTPDRERNPLSEPHSPGNRYVATPCQVCEKRTDVPLCFECVRKLRESLLVAQLVAGELPTNIVRLARAQGPYRIGGRSTETPLPFDVEAGVAAWILAEVLGSWGDRLSTQGVPYFRDATTEQLARWLARHSLRLGRLPDAGACYRQVGDAVEQCLDVVEPIRRRTPSDPEDVERGRSLYVTAAEAQRYLGEVHGITVRATRIRKWGERRQLNKIGDYYRVGDILDRLTAMS